MSTPLKALIQERLRAKMVRQGPGYDVDDGYSFDSDRMLRQPVDVTAYDISSRGDDEDTPVSSRSRGSTSRRTNSAATQPTYPVRLHTHIDPSAYLVPSEHEDRYYAPSSSYGSGSSSHGDHTRPRYSRYPREQYRDLDVYNPPPRPEQQQHKRRRHHSHQRAREQQPPRYESPFRGMHVSRDPSPSRAVSPWRRTEYATAPCKSSSISRSPVHAAPSPTYSPTSRRCRKQDFDYPAHNNNCTRHDRESKSILPSPRFTAPSSSTHPTYRQEYYQRQRYTWKERDHDFDNQAAYEVREPSPTQHHGHHDYPAFSEPVRRPSEHRNHPNQSKNDNTARYSGAALPSPHKPEPEEMDTPEVTQRVQEPERQSPPTLDMKIIEPPTKTTGRTRAWDDIMSPESRLAAKAFVEKRQRRAEKSTPRTMATQRWLEVIDARAKQLK